MHKRNIGLIKLGKIILALYLFIWIPFDIWSHLLRPHVEAWLTPTLSAYINSSFLFAFYLIALLRFWTYFLNVKNVESVAFHRHRSITHDDTRAIPSNHKKNSKNNKNGQNSDDKQDEEKERLRIDSLNAIASHAGQFSGLDTNYTKLQEFKVLLRLFGGIWLGIMIITGIASFVDNSSLVLKLVVDGSVVIIGIVITFWFYYRLFIKKHDYYGFLSFNFYFLDDQWYIKHEFMYILLNTFINFLVLLIATIFDYSHYSELYAIWLAIIIETLIVHDFIISTFIIVRLNKHNISIDIDVIDSIFVTPSLGSNGSDAGGLNLDAIEAPLDMVDNDDSKENRKNGKKSKKSTKNRKKQHRSFEALYNSLIEQLSRIDGYDEFMHFLEKEFEAANLIFITELIHFRDYLMQTCLLGDVDKNYELVDTLGFLFKNIQARGSEKELFMLPNQVPKTMLAEKYHSQLFKQSKEQYFYNIFVTFNVIYQKFLGNSKSPMNLSKKMNDDILERVEDRYQILSDRQCIESEEEIEGLWLDLVECGKIIWNLLILSYARMQESSN